MLDLYKKILAQSKDFRQKLAFAITAFLGVIIFSFWLIFSVSSFSKITVGEEEIKKESIENIPKMPSLKENFDEIKSDLEEIKNTQDLTPTLVPTSLEKQNPTNPSESPSESIDKQLENTTNIPTTPTPLPTFIQTNNPIL